MPRPRAFRLESYSDHGIRSAARPHRQGARQGARVHREPEICRLRWTRRRTQDSGPGRYPRGWLADGLLDYVVPLSSTDRPTWMGTCRSSGWSKRRMKLMCQFTDFCIRIHVEDDRRFSTSSTPRRRWCAAPSPTFGTRAWTVCPPGSSDGRWTIPNAPCSARSEIRSSRARTPDTTSSRGATPSKSPFTADRRILHGEIAVVDLEVVVEFADFPSVDALTERERGRCE